MDENQNMNNGQQTYGDQQYNNGQQTYGNQQYNNGQQTYGDQQYNGGQQTYGNPSTARITGHRRSSMVRFQIFSAICY